MFKLGMFTNESCTIKSDLLAVGSGYGADHAKVRSSPKLKNGKIRETAQSGWVRRMGSSVVCFEPAN